MDVFIEKAKGYILTIRITDLGGFAKSHTSNEVNNFIKEFEKTFENYPFTLKDGSYVFTDPIQNKVAREGIQSQNESK